MQDSIIIDAGAERIDDAKFTAFLKSFASGVKMSERAANNAIHAAARDLLFRKSTDRADQLTKAATGTPHERAIKQALLDYTGGWYQDSFGTFRDSEQAAMAWDKKAKAWAFKASAAELAEAIGKYRTIEKIAYTALQFDSLKRPGLDLDAVREQVARWTKKPENWQSEDAETLAAVFAELMPLIGMEVPLNVANRRAKKAA